MVGVQVEIQWHCKLFRGYILMRHFCDVGNNTLERGSVLLLLGGKKPTAADTNIFLRVRG